MTTAQIIQTIENKTGITIEGDPDRIVLALAYLSNDKFKQEVNDAVWANRKVA